MKQRIYDISILLCVGAITLFAGFYIGRMTASNIVNVPAVQQAYDNGELQHTSLCIDLNKASVDDLKLLPGVDKIMAENIIKYRKQYGAFVSVNELLYVDGMTKQLYTQIKQHVIVGG